MKDAIQAGQLPPDQFPTAGLSGSARHPSLDELKGIYDFLHRADCMERTFFEYVNSRSSWSDRTQFGESVEWRHWRDRFYSTIYRVFLAGAMKIFNTNALFESSQQTNGRSSVQFAEEAAVKNMDEIEKIERENFILSFLTGLLFIVSYVVGQAGKMYCQASLALECYQFETNHDSAKNDLRHLRYVSEVKFSLISTRNNRT